MSHRTCCIPMHSITQPHRQQEIGYSQQTALWALRHPYALLHCALPPCVVQAVRQRVLWSARKEKADSTRRSSRAVPHPSTNRALRRLTSEVRRDPVYSTRYGRQRKLSFSSPSASAVQLQGEAVYLTDMRGTKRSLHFSTAAPSSGAGPQTRCAERCSAEAQRKKGPNPTACGSGRESTTPTEPGSPSACGLTIALFAKRRSSHTMPPVPFLASVLLACALAQNVEPHWVALQRNCLHFPISSLWGAISMCMCNGWLAKKIVTIFYFFIFFIFFGGATIKQSFVWFVYLFFFFCLGGHHPKSSFLLGGWPPSIFLTYLLYCEPTIIIYLFCFLGATEKVEAGNPA